VRGQEGGRGDSGAGHQAHSEFRGSPVLGRSEDVARGVFRCGEPRKSGQGSQATGAVMLAMR